MNSNSSICRQQWQASVHKTWKQSIRWKWN